ncbi:MAG TPA: NADH-quinone oxidoreductase subunit M [Gammaproteobacteria bacterium]|nr:NADH-quinone oxidoreductase subunit M [Gammaproteobacteria bacterium]
MIESIPILSLAILALLAGGLLIVLAPDHRTVRWVALTVAVLELVLTVIILVRFDAQLQGFQMVEKANWIPTLNIQYQVGVDGISILFLPLTAVLFLAVIIASWNMVRVMPRLYFGLLLLLEAAVMGIYLALDTMMFFLFWEMTLISFYFLISLWGIGPQRRFAAAKYTLYMLIGGVPLLFAFILLAINHADQTGMAIPAGLSFDYATLLATELPSGTGMVVFLLLLAGFAVKTPLFPLHTWLPVVSMEGPIAAATLMVGLKLGAYGLIRYAIPLAPEAAQQLHWLLVALAVAGILYGALAAMAQTNLRRMLAYSSISHVGLVVLGIASFNIQGIQGAVFQTLNFIIISGGAFLLTGFLYQRTGSTDFISLGGVARSMPLLTAFYFLFGIAGMGIPGTSGFPAEFLLLFSALKTHTGAGLAALVGVVIGAVYFLRIYRRAFLGAATSRVIVEAADLRKHELLIAAALALLILIAGFYPAIVLDVTRVASEDWIANLATASP